MAQIKEMQGLTCIVPFLRLVQSAEGHAAHHFLFRHGKHLDVLNKIVAKLVVEFLLNLLEFLLCFLGKSRSQVLTHDLGAVELAYEETEEV